MRKDFLYLLLSFGLSWSIGAVIWLARLPLTGGVAVALLVAYMFMPALSAFLTQKVIYKEPVKGPLGISFKVNGWWVVAWLLPFVLTALIVAAGLLLPGTSLALGAEHIIGQVVTRLDPEQGALARAQMEAMPLHPLWMFFIQALVAGLTVNAIAGFGEELGWRGFLQNEWSYMGFWRSSLLIGLVWGIWHAPIILQGHNYPEHPVAGVFMMTAFCVLMGPIISFVRLKARSVIAAAILHGTINAVAGIGLIVVTGGSDLLTGMTGLAGLAVLLLANLLLIPWVGSLSQE